MEITKKDILIKSLLTEQQAKKVKTVNFEKMASEILTSRNQAHVFHLQTKSYAEHIALNTYYDTIIGLFDGIVESFQGKYGIITNFTCEGVDNYKNNESTIKYFEKLVKNIEKYRKSIDDSYLDNQVDTIIELIYSTIYKLRFLS